MRRVLLGLSLVVAMLVISACNVVRTENITPIPTPDLPTAQILSPANNRQIIEGTVFDIDIVARDLGAGVGRVALFVDGELINEASPSESESEPIFRVTMNWRAEGIGFHLVEAIAYRPDETPSDPARINIEVLPGES